MLKTNTILSTFIWCMCVYVCVYLRMSVYVRCVQWISVLPRRVWLSSIEKDFRCPMFSISFLDTGYLSKPKSETCSLSARMVS